MPQVNTDDRFAIKRQWKKFCEHAGIPENKMPPDQRREMRRAFYGAWGQALIHLRDEISALPEIEAIAVMDRQLNEVADFWLAEKNQNN